ncbi:MAG: hypothetical protein KF716_33130, partial [Anaerolineae bacterium]|nr:hypothetical protein [Anaerolineae bacterium]
QQAYLGVIVILSILIALNTLRRLRLNPPRPTYIPDQYGPTSRYLIWRKVLTTLQSSSFSREQFIQEARKLVLSLLAYQYSVSESEVEYLVRGDTLDLPIAIRNLLQRQGLQVAPSPVPQSAIRRWRDRLFKPAPPYDPRLDQQVEEIIQFIEQQMELTYARS